MFEARQQGENKRALNVSKQFQSWVPGKELLQKQARHFAKLSMLERGPHLEFKYSYRPADFCRGATLASEFEWTESAEVASTDRG